MQEITVTENDRILIIAPHPDDECCGAGGILFRFPKKCSVLVLTDGRQGQGDILPEKLKEIRLHEFIDEMKWLGITSFHNLQIEDGTLLAHTDCLENYPLLNYTKIFVTGLNDSHPDHKAAFLCLKNAINKQKNVVVNQNNLDSSKDVRIPQCFSYEVHTPLQNPTHFSDITNIISDKLKLIQFHRSQLKELPYDVLAEQFAAFRGTLFRMPGKKIEVYEEVTIDEVDGKGISETDILLQKERVIGWILKRWVSRLQKGIRFSKYLINNGIQELYVYGYGDIGKLLLSELLEDGFNVRAVIDRRAGQFNNEITKIVTINEADPKIPVIVTVIGEREKIESLLTEKGFIRIFFLKNMLESEE